MKWKTVTLPPIGWTYHGAEYLTGVEQVLVNDDNEQWCHNDGSWTAENTEIYVDKGKPTLLITLGESWTYGEGTEVINHRHHKWEIRDRIEVTYSGKMARLLDSDLWTFGCPGNSNSGIYAGLFRILDNIPVGRYQSIKVIVQMTACDRDNLEFAPVDYPLRELIDPSKEFKEEEKISLEQWFVRHDEIFFDMLNQEIAKHSNLNLDVIVCKNFNDIWTKRRDYNFRIVETFWLQYHAAWHGIDLKQCYVMHPDFYKFFMNHSKIIKNVDLDFISRDFDNWEKLVAFLETHNDTNHSSHPTQISHILWTKFLLDFAQWPLITKI